MTEEIIIDGVNVSECKYLNKVVNEEPYCNIDEEHLYTCSSDENCYFKQLQRLEQENKSNKELLIIAQNEAMEAQFDREKYKDALEEIRIMATKDVSIESFVKIQNKINEVLR